MVRIFKLFAIWRVFLFLPVFSGVYILAERLGYGFTNPWGNFDGVRYLAIASRGYITEAAFFPLYPIVIRIFSFLGGYFLSGFLVSNIAFLISLFYLYKLLKLDYPADRSSRILLYLVLFPTAFFFGALYSESLFFLLLVLSFYFARKGKWLGASLAAMLLGATRIIGILVLPALVYELYIQKKNIKDGLSLLMVPIGLAAYSLFNFLKWGDALYFIKAHGELGNSRSVDAIVLFPQTVYRYLKILISLPVSQYEWWIALLEISVFFGVCFLLYCAWWKKVRSSYLIFSLLAFLLPVLSGTFSGLPRYVLVLFPIYIALAGLGRGFRRAYLIFSAILLFILLMFFSRGYFVA